MRPMLFEVAAAAATPATPIICDNFAGGGGASTGIETAIGRPIDVAINHDPEAVAMHRANHPRTKHYCQSIMAIDPMVATGGAPVALAWFSPDCKHHSKAKGGVPREKRIRDLATIVPHWAERLSQATPNASGAPAVIMLENVEEFRQWGPLDAEGFPIKDRKGEEFDLWVRQLKRLGYKVEYRELRACDYGAPTSRKRLYLIARRDGRKIVWPAPSHGKPGTKAVLLGQLAPWRSAAECIDWSIPCPSIFDRPRDLKPATLRRIAHGVMRYVVDAAEPFIVDGAEIVEVSATGGERREIDATIIPITHAADGPGRAHDPAEPLRTITTANGGELARVTATVAPVIVGCGGRRGQSGPVDPKGPYPTTTAKADACLVAATMVQTGYGEREGQAPRSLDVQKPIGTLVAGAGKHAAVTAFLSHFYGSNTKGSGGDPTEPTRSVTAEGQHHAVICAHMEQANTGAVGHSMQEAVSTVLGKGANQRLVQTTMVEADALPPDMMDRAVRTAAFLVKYYGAAEHGQAVDRPLDAVTSKARFAVVTVTIDARTYVIVDIGMRMLTPRELARAQGFPDNYILDPIGPNGRPLSKAAQIRMIGNSVCPDVAEALVRANLPELCTGTADAGAEVAA